MSGHYCTIAPAQQRRQESSPAWRLAVVAIAACAATACVLFAAVPRTPSQHYTAVNAARVRTTARSLPVAMQSTKAMDSVEQVNSRPAAFDAATVYEVTQATSTVGTLAFTGGLLMLLGAAATYARQLMAPGLQGPKTVAMASATGETEKEQMRQLVANLDAADMRLLSRGGSMEDVARSRGIDEVAQAIRADQLSRKDLTPKDVVLEMQRGNGRFWMGLSERPDMDAMSRRALIMAQAPKICILSCSDSRVPVEIIFDQGLGEIFVVRMAGNILDANAHGSIEYAVKYLGVKVILVIGHEGCGAVKGAIGMSPDDIAKEPFDLQVVLQSIRGGLDVKELNGITDVRSREREAIVLNTSNQVKKLQQNQLIAEKVSDGTLLVAGAFYEISSGIVDFFSLDKNGLVIDI